MAGGAQGTARPWWRRGLLGACRTGEYVEATPWRDWLRHELRHLPWLLLAAGGLWFAKAWIAQQGLEIEALRASDPAQAAQQARALLRAFALGSLALVLPVTAVACAVMGKVLRAGRWPLPGVPVLRRTQILRGHCLRLRFGLPCAALIAVAGLATIGAAKLHGVDAGRDRPGDASSSTSISGRSE